MFRCLCIACCPHRHFCSIPPDPFLRLYFREWLFAHHSFPPAQAKLAGSTTAACDDGTLSLRGAGRAFAATFALSCCIFEAGVLLCSMFLCKRQQQWDIDQALDCCYPADVKVAAAAAAARSWALCYFTRRFLLCKQGCCARREMRLQYV